MRGAQRKRQIDQESGQTGREHLAEQTQTGQNAAEGAESGLPGVLGPEDSLAAGIKGVYLRLPANWLCLTFSMKMALLSARIWMCLASLRSGQATLEEKQVVRGAAGCVGLTGTGCVGVVEGLVVGAGNDVFLGEGTLDEALACGSFSAHLII